MRHITKTAVLVAILALAVAALAGTIRGHHSAAAHQTRVASGWTSYVLPIQLS